MFRRPHTLSSCALLLLFLVAAVQSLFDLWNAPLKDDLGESTETGKREKIFIASMHWNNEAILCSHWIDAVAQLTESVGAANVFVSVQESGSWDGPKRALRLLNGILETSNVSRSIILDDTTHRDEITWPPSDTGWIYPPRGKQEPRRIPYLARLRNLVLQPLDELSRQCRYFDKILFLNDVVFTVQDARRLLNTRHGNYAAACALDFAKPPSFYDTFASRGSDGHDALMQNWPFFRSRASRRAIKANQPTPVQSCWNGIGTASLNSLLLLGKIDIA